MTDPTINDATRTDFLEQSADASVGAALRNMGGATILLVMDDSSGQPLGVASKAFLREQDPAAWLRDLEDEMEPPTLVDPGIPVADVLRIMEDENTSRWQIVMAGDDAIAVVAPETVRDLALGAPSLPGNPHTVFELVYTCPGAGDPKHDVRSIDVQRYTPSGRALCPNHEKTVMSLKIKKS